MRAILLASATATTLKGRRARTCVSQGYFPGFSLARRNGHRSRVQPDRYRATSRSGTSKALAFVFRQSACALSARGLRMLHCRRFPRAVEDAFLAPVGADVE